MTNSNGWSEIEALGWRARKEGRCVEERSGLELVGNSLCISIREAQDFGMFSLGVSSTRLLSHGWSG